MWLSQVLHPGVLIIETDIPSVGDTLVAAKVSGSIPAGVTVEFNSADSTQTMAKQVEAQIKQ